MPTPSDHRRLIRFDALGVLDGHGAAYSPGSVLVEWEGAGGAAKILAVGRTAEVSGHEAAQVKNLQVVARSRAILIPGLVNAHVHLDLTHIGPRPHDPQQGFVSWIDMIRRERRTDPDAIAVSVRRGIELSLSAGVVAVGDIAGATRGRPDLTAWRTLRDSALAGVSFLEFFGIGATQDRAAKAVEETLAEAKAEGLDDNPIRLGLQPHAPNTVATGLYRRAIDLARDQGLPLSTHLAETLEEREFVGQGTGPQRELLERLGIWDDSILEDVGQGRSPVEHLSGVLGDASQRASPFLAAHVNDADDEAIRMLVRTRTRVVYCPRASAYFGAERVFGAHRYREMLSAGITVALGTDSIVNLPSGCDHTPAESQYGRGIGVLDEMRFLFARDRTDPALLLRMGTTNGAAALGLPESAFRFTDGGALSGLVAVEVAQADGQPPRFIPEADLGRVLMSEGSGRPELLFNRTCCDLTGKERE